MPRKRRFKGDPIEYEIELALNPGDFISYSDSFSFVSDLGDIADKISRLISSDPARAVILYETFLASCDMKIEELDDSSGSFGQLVDELYCGWIKARQANKADPEETALQLLTWIDQDEHGFCYQLERDAVKVFNKATLGAFVKLVRARFDAVAQNTPKKDYKPLERPDYLRSHWGDILRSLYAAQKNVAAYVAIAEETGLTARDCHVVATLLQSRRKAEDALTWVERGFEIDKQTLYGSMANNDLTELKRNLLTKLGRGEEALLSAWSDYQKRPCNYTYKDLMKYVPKAQRKEWHEKAIEVAMSADPGSVMELLLKTRELGRLADFVRQTQDEALEDLSHYLTEPVAGKLEKSHPDLAARLWLAQALRIVKAKKSRYYDAALSNFDRARRCFLRANLEDNWNSIVLQVRADHHRKSSLMPGFERLVKGSSPTKKPSFLEIAKNAGA